MSAVIPFPTSRIRPMSEAGKAVQAEVIIFPGVQIERMDFDLSERLPLRGKSQSRKARANERDAY